MPEKSVVEWIAVSQERGTAEILRHRTARRIELKRPCLRFMNGSMVGRVYAMNSARLERLQRALHSCYVGAYGPGDTVHYFVEKES